MARIDPRKGTYYLSGESIEWDALAVGIDTAEWSSIGGTLSLLFILLAYAAELMSLADLIRKNGVTIGGWPAPLVIDGSLGLPSTCLLSMAGG